MFRRIVLLCYRFAVIKFIRLIVFISRPKANACYDLPKLRTSLWLHACKDVEAFIVQAQQGIQLRFVALSGVRECVTVAKVGEYKRSNEPYLSLRMIETEKNNEENTKEKRTLIYW